MKIAVYAIARDEEKFVARMITSAAEADHILICDTGSSDRTREIAAESGAEVHEISVHPWRFDTARNASLAMLPPDIDIAVCLDCDEVLTPGWRGALEAAARDNPEATRFRYFYVWSWMPDGSPGLTYWGDKIHRRHGYAWRNIVHEVAVWRGEGVEREAFVQGLSIHHHADPAKSRAQYLPMLELACAEDPADDRNSHYLGREYLIQGMPEKAIVELQRHLSLPSSMWMAERAASMRYIARALRQLGRDQEAMVWLLRACAECTGTREPWVEHAVLCHDLKHWAQCYSSALYALAIKNRPQTYISDPDCWGARPHILAAAAAWNIGLHHAAVRHAEDALLLVPGDAANQAIAAAMRAKIESMAGEGAGDGAKS